MGTLHERLDAWPQQALNLDADAALGAVVDEFYDTATNDERLASFFEGADMDSLRKHKFSFMRYAFSDGQAGDYTGRSIQNAHSRLISELGLNENHFDYVAEDVVSALNKFNVPQEIIDDVVAVVAPLHSFFEVGK